MSDEKEMNAVLEENAILREQISRICTKCDKASEERDAAIRERDEARQLACEFCVMDGSGYSSSYRAKEEAIARGWDCFKETQ